MKKPEIEDQVFKEWQDITNLVVKLCNVPSALLMRINKETMEVMSASDHPDSPYRVSETAPLEGKLYCETVIETQCPLHIPNALKDPVWDHNPDIELGMISYFGVPVNWPDNSPFGTFCILDKKEKLITDDEREIISRFARIIEITLKLMVSEHELLELNKKLEAKSLQDSLTGIANRRMFNTRVNEDWSRCIRNKQPISLIMIDIDYFKFYNDRYGHLLGDKSLRKVAQKLAEQGKRSEDLCARYGGEEFVLLLPNISLEEAIRLAEKCREEIYQCSIPHESSKVCDVLTISVGVSSATPAIDSFSSSLIEDADKALYFAKESGRNRVKVFPENITERKLDKSFL